MARQLFCPRMPHLHKGVLLRWAAAGLLHELAIDLALQFRVDQAHLQRCLGQGYMVVHGGRFHRHIDEQLAGLAQKWQWARADQQPLD